MQSAIPILRSFDENLMRAFYLDFLGFEIGFTHRFAPELPLYVEVRRGDCVIHLSEHYGDASPAGALRIPMDDVHGYCATLNEKNHGHARPSVQSQPFGWDDMCVTDPFGNRLVFCTAHAS